MVRNLNVPVAPLQCADVGISEFVCGDVPGIGGRIKCFPEDFQVNEVRLRDKAVVRPSFPMVACDAHGRLVLGTEHWLRQPCDGEGRVQDPLQGHRPGRDETAFRFVSAPPSPRPRCSLKLPAHCWLLRCL